MSEPENFLERWSRRKMAPKDEKDSVREDVAADAASESAETAEATDLPADAQAKSGDKTRQDEPEFDLSKLPSIDSITATTDIRMFMLPGVPMALRQAALRKVWVTDPKIRDFIEMAENQWDFTVNSPGFDFSPPTGDIKKMVAEVFGKNGEEEKKPDTEAEKAEKADMVAAPAGPENPEGDSTPPPEEPVSTRISEPTIPVRASLYEPQSPPSEQKVVTENIASQKNDATHIHETTEQELPRRRHGSALPG